MIESISSSGGILTENKEIYFNEPGEKTIEYVYGGHSYYRYVTVISRETIYDKPGEYTHTVNYSGDYLLTAAGSQGEAQGGYGGVVSGTIYLEKGDKLELRVGGNSSEEPLNKYSGGKGSFYGGGSSIIKYQKAKETEGKTILIGAATDQKRTFTDWTVEVLPKQRSCTELEEAGPKCKNCFKYVTCPADGYSDWELIRLDQRINKCNDSNNSYCSTCLQYSTCSEVYTPWIQGKILTGETSCKESGSPECIGCKKYNTCETNVTEWVKDTKNSKTVTSCTPVESKDCPTCKRYTTCDYDKDDWEIISTDIIPIDSCQPINTRDCITCSNYSTCEKNNDDPKTAIRKRYKRTGVNKNIYTRTVTYDKEKFNRTVTYDKEIFNRTVIYDKEIFNRTVTYDKEKFNRKVTYTNTQYTRALDYDKKIYERVPLYKATIGTRVYVSDNSELLQGGIGNGLGGTSEYKDYIAANGLNGSGGGSSPKAQYDCNCKTCQRCSGKYKYGNWSSETCDDAPDGCSSSSSDTRKVRCTGSGQSNKKRCEKSRSKTCIQEDYTCCTKCNATGRPGSGGSNFIYSSGDILLTDSLSKNGSNYGIGSIKIELLTE